MSLNSNDSGRADGAAASSDRAPQLRAGGYAAWKPAMDVHLQRHGAANVHKEPLTEDEWRDDCSDVAAWSTQSLAAARARARAANGGSASVNGVKQPPPAAALSAEEKADRLTVIAHVERLAQGVWQHLLGADGRSAPAGGAHLAGLGVRPVDVARAQVSEHRSRQCRCAADALGVAGADGGRVIRSVPCARQLSELAALLKHAKQEQTPEMYCLFLLKRLQPRYTSAVLALENGVMLKTLAAGTVDWDAVTALIAVSVPLALRMRFTRSSNPGACSS